MFPCLPTRAVVQVLWPSHGTIKRNPREMISITADVNYEGKWLALSTVKYL